MVPAVETVQAARLLQCVKAGAHIQMVRVAEDYLRLDVVFEFALVHRLDRSHRADGHENRGLDGSVGGGDFAGAGLRLAVGGLQFKKHQLRMEVLGGCKNSIFFKGQTRSAQRSAGGGANNRQAEP